MGIPFITMDAHNIVNNIVNDAVGIPPAAPEPAGPIDITDQCTSQGVAWGNGGNITITIPNDYIGYYVEIITEWPGASSISQAQSDIDYPDIVIDGNRIITKGFISQNSNLIQVNSGNGLYTKPTVVSVKVDENKIAPTEPVDIKDQVTFDSSTSGSSGYIELDINPSYNNYYIEIVTRWPGAVELSDISVDSGLDNSNNTVDGEKLITKGTVSSSLIDIEINSGSGLNTRPDLISVRVFKTAF